MMLRQGHEVGFGKVVLFMETCKRFQDFALSFVVCTDFQFPSGTSFFQRVGRAFGSHLRVDFSI